MEGQKKRIMLIDDESSIVRLLRAILQEASYEVLTGTSVAEGQALLAENPVDLLITDINMPKESGLVLIDHVKRQYPMLPVIIATVIDNVGEAQKMLESGVYGYLVKPFNKNLVLITVANALRLHQLEMQQKAYQRALENEHRAIMDNLPLGLLVLNSRLEIVEANKQLCRWFNHALDERHSKTFEYFCRKIDAGHLLHFASSLVASGKKECCTFCQANDKNRRSYRVTGCLVPVNASGLKSLVLMFEDQTESLAIERELRQAQKLEAIGQLAAGIAHEINTPVQYIGDNIRFLADSFRDIFNYVSKIEDSLIERRTGQVIDELGLRVEKLRAESDIEFLKQEIPVTLEQCLEGIGRVGKIVRAMKEFSHPGVGEKVQIDINKALESTVTVSRNEWKYHAELKTDLAPDLPLVLGLPAELNQVFLNLIVNAAHAIAARVSKGDYERGCITVKTFTESGQVIVQVIDNGIGIPEPVRHRIFDPFFTTKPVGKGTGQGLAITRDIVVKKHGGTIDCESQEGDGAIFSVRLPETA